MAFYHQIPDELKQYNNFVVWKLKDVNGKLTKIPYSAATGKQASHNESSDYSPWVSFNYAYNVLWEHPDWYDGMGFVLSINDPYCIIDLDDTEGNDDLLNKQIEIYKYFQTYTEVSPSGKGVHLILKGNVPVGRKKDKVEIYSSQRFMTLTGNWLYGRYVPIRDDKSKEINELYEHLSKGKNDNNKNNMFDFSNEQDSYTDEQVFEFCSTNEKFRDLWQGDWKKYNYDSQSEADLALCAFISLYCNNYSQLQRIFSQSALYMTINRKPNPKDYLIRLALKVFSTKVPSLDTSGIRSSVFQALQNREHAPILENPEISTYSPNYVPYETPSTWRERGEQDFCDMPHELNPITCPPGYLGEIATFIYNQMPRKVPEFAIVSSMGVMAGILGRYLNINNLGLNQYWIMVGTTATGKEGAGMGFNKIFNAVSAIYESASKFKGAGDFASREGLLRNLQAKPSMTAYMGETGVFLRNMLDYRASPAKIDLQRTLLDLYSKSGQGNSWNGSEYASRDKNIGEIKSPAFSIVGDTTPETLYKHINDENIMSGLFPRFTIVEYWGKSPYLNEDNEKIIPTREMIDYIAAICRYSMERNMSNAVIHVQMEERVKDVLREFERKCTDLINHNKHDMSSYLWSRAHARVLKTAALLAGTQNYYKPVITFEMAEWSLKFIENSVFNLINRLSTNTLGDGYKSDKSQYDTIIQIVKFWVKSSWKTLSQYRQGNEFMHKDRVVPFAFINRMGLSKKCFKDDRYGATNAIKKVINLALQSGDLVKVFDVVKYGVKGDLYYISDSALY